MLKSTCINCHALDVMLRHRGFAAGQWRNYVEKQMQARIGVLDPGDAAATATSSR
jgi:hypothetical protein